METLLYVGLGCAIVAGVVAGVVPLTRYLDRRRWTSRQRRRDAAQSIATGD